MQKKIETGWMVRGSDQRFKLSLRLRRFDPKYNTGCLCLRHEESYVASTTLGRDMGPTGLRFGEPLFVVQITKRECLRNVDLSLSAYRDRCVLNEQEGKPSGGANCWCLRYM
jgi:hypothetical protein